MLQLASLGGLALDGVLFLGLLAMLYGGLKGLVGGLGQLWTGLVLTVFSPSERLDSPSGPVEVSGTARPVEDGETITAPLSGTEALFCTVDIQRYSPDTEGSGGWKTVERRERGVPVRGRDRRRNALRRS